MKNSEAILIKGLTQDLINGYKILNGARYFSSGTLQNNLICFSLSHLKFYHGNL